MIFQNNFHFIDRWRVKSTIAEVYPILLDGSQYGRWWPSIYRKTEEITPGDEHGVGAVTHVLTKAWLPYSIDWKATVLRAEPADIYMKSVGDFEGNGHWILEQDGDWLNITFDWNLNAEQPLLVVLSQWLKPLMYPFFRWNHKWAMTQGEKSLVLELLRRKSKTMEELKQIPYPPGPPEFEVFYIFLGGLALGLITGLFGKKRTAK